MTAEPIPTRIHWHPLDVVVDGVGRVFKRGVDGWLDPQVADADVFGLFPLGPLTDEMVEPLRLLRRIEPEWKPGDVIELDGHPLRYGLDGYWYCDDCRPGHHDPEAVLARWRHGDVRIVSK